MADFTESQYAAAIPRCCSRQTLPPDCKDDDVYCSTTCRENAAEAAYERSQEEPCYRGGEWAAAQAAEAEWIKRNLK